MINYRKEQMTLEDIKDLVDNALILCDQLQSKEAKSEFKEALSLLANKLGASASSCHMIREDNV